jgi:hypothetical protein
VVRLQAVLGGGGMGFAAAIELLFAISICLIGLLYGTPPHSPHASTFSPHMEY